MKKHLLTLLFFIPLLSFAQSNYKKGYVVSLKGDTLQGYIDYKEWGHNPTTIRFKDALANRSQQFGTNDISCFEVKGFEYYERYVLKISLDAVDLGHIPMGVDTSFKTDTVFLKILKKGKNVTLYAYNDAIKNRFFINDNDMPIPQELIYRVYLDPDNANNLITKNLYYGQLNALALKHNLGSSELTKQIKNLIYNNPSLIKITSIINGEDEKLNVKNLKKTGRSRLFLGTGLNTSTLTYDGDGPFPTGTSSSSNSPLLTIGFDSFANPNVGRLIFRIEMAFTTNNFAFITSSNPGYSAFKDTSIQKIKQLMAAFTPQVIYNFYNTDNLKVFLGAGVSLDMATYPTNIFTKTYLGTKRTTNDSEEVQKVWWVVPIKAGLVINKHLELYTTYIQPVSPLINNYVNYSVNQVSYQFGVNYLFGKK